MRVLLGAIDTPVDLYTLSGITAGTMIQIQPVDRYEIRTSCEANAPTDYHDFHQLDQWAEYAADNIWLWSPQDAAAVVVLPSPGRVL